MTKLVVVSLYVDRITYEPSHLFPFISFYTFFKFKVQIKFKARFLKVSKVSRLALISARRETFTNW